MVQIVITADISSNCGYAKIIDDSVYTGQEPRSNFGIAIFVEEAGIMNYGLSDFTNSDPWYIPIQNNTQYEIIAFQVPVWVAGTYAIDEVVYDVATGLFWYNSSGAPTTEQPGVGTAWTEVPNDVNGLAMFNNESTSITTTVVQQTCPDYTLSKVQCNDPASCCKTWRVCDNSGNMLIKYIGLFDYLGNYISMTYIDPNVETCKDIVLTDSGVYTVGILAYGTSPTPLPHILFQYQTTYTDWLVIYEYCQIQQCAQYLIDQILCSSDPCTEVCNPCNPDKIKAQQNARAELNRIIALFGTLLGMINAEKITYLGTYDMNATRADFVSKIGLYFVKVNDLAIRCGICTGTNVQTGGNPVFQNVAKVSGQRKSGCTECH